MSKVARVAFDEYESSIGQALDLIGAEAMAACRRSDHHEAQADEFRAAGNNERRGRLGNMRDIEIVTV